MTALTSLVALAALSGVAADTPVEKVITLLEDLVDQIEKEGKKEADTYSKFACFCKDKTTKKSDSIKEQNDVIDDRTATIEEKTTARKVAQSDLLERKARHEKLAAELDTETARIKKLKAEYEVEEEDLSAALASLDKAKASLEAAKPAALVQIAHRPSAARIQAGQAFKEVLFLADAMGVGSHKMSLLQSSVDPDDPDYVFKSDGLIKLLVDLHKDFTDQKDKLTEDWENEEKASSDLVISIQEKIDSNDVEMGSLEESIDTLKSEVADAKSDLLRATSLLTDDSQYLKDLTSRCQDSAKEYDQRTSTRHEELEALAKAMEIIREDVKSADENVNKRAFFLLHPKPIVTTTTVAASSAVVANSTAGVSTTPTVGLAQNESASSHVAQANNRQPSTARKAIGLLTSRGTSFLERTSRSAREEVTAMLRREGRSLASTALLSVSDRVKTDPLAKVKKLIQDLLFRMLNEAKDEATKQGFCDTELAKAKQEQNMRFLSTQKLSAEAGQLMVQQDSFEVEIAELSEAVKSLSADLAEASKLREEDRLENGETLKTAKQGLESVSEAIDILKVFYKKSAKALLTQIGASPVDEDTEGPGFSGSYKGKQDESNGVIGILEVVKSDFEHTMDRTSQQEKEAAAAFVVFERSSKADIAGKETKTALDEQELEATKRSKRKAMEDLKTEQGLLDDVLKSIEELKPMCIDTGMSYADRVAKREAEIEALKKAVCMLDPEGVEADCK